MIPILTSPLPTPLQIQEVVSTPVTLPVKERIALGLSKGGTSNTFKVFAYNAIFGSMAYFATGAIKQFCIFTVVVLVAHWFLIHTFFVAVLAIDIQRLEVQSAPSIGAGSISDFHVVFSSQTYCDRERD